MKQNLVLRTADMKITRSKTSAKTKSVTPTALLFMGALAVACLAQVGCGSGSAEVLHGSVTHGDEKVPMGRISFLPTEGARGTNYTTRITDGQYRLQAKGGMPPGKYRVLVDAKKKTGRQVMGYTGMERAMTDEQVRMGPAIYAGNQSPLLVDVGDDSQQQHDITIPLKEL